MYLNYTYIYFLNIYLNYLFISFIIIQDNATKTLILGFPFLIKASTVIDKLSDESGINLKKYVRMERLAYLNEESRTKIAKIAESLSSDVSTIFLFFHHLIFFYSTHIKKSDFFLSDFCLHILFKKF